MKRQGAGNASRLVYTTDSGNVCTACGKRLDRCACSVKPALPTGDGIVRVGRSTAGRKGKGMTVVTGIPLDERRLKQLARALKRKCGSGGTVKAGTIEIQGDHRETLTAALKARGYAVKRTGG
jgi:translation initiation factor 1